MYRSVDFMTSLVQEDVVSKFNLFTKRTTFNGVSTLQCSDILKHFLILPKWWTSPKMFKMLSLRKLWLYSRSSKKSSPKHNEIYQIDYNHWGCWPGIRVEFARSRLDDGCVTHDHRIWNQKFKVGINKQAKQHSSANSYSVLFFHFWDWTSFTHDRFAHTHILGAQADQRPPQ